MPEFITPPRPTPTTTFDIAQISNAIEIKDFNQSTNTPFSGLIRLNGVKVNALSLSFLKDIFIKDEEEYLVAYNIEFYGSLILNNIGNDRETINFIFYNCIISGINLTSSKTGSWLFIRSFVEKDIHITNTSTDFIRLSDNSSSGKIWIQSESQVGDIYLDTDSRNNQIGIANYSKSGMISIYNSICNHISITHYSKVNFIEIDGSEVGSINVFGFSISGFIKTANSSIGPITVLEHSQLSEIYLFDLSKNESINIRGKSQCSKIEVLDSSVTAINITEVVISLFVKNSHLQFVKLTNCTLYKLEWLSGSRGELYINNGRILYLLMTNTSLSKETLLSFNNVIVYIIRIDKLFVNGQLLFRNIRSLNFKDFKKWDSSIIKKLYKKRPKANGLLSHLLQFEDYIIEIKKQRSEYRDYVNNLINIINLPTFLVSDSSLGKAEITGSDLTGFKFEYRDTKLLDCFLSGTQLPKKNIEIFGNGNPVSQEQFKDFHEQKISIYNQLRKIFDIQGDIVEATWYQSKAMEHQQKLLKLNYQTKHQPKWYSVKKRFTDEGFDLFNFRLNKFSNNHGESWGRALLFLLGGSLVIYTAYYISIFYEYQFSWSETWQFFGNYFSFFDITHKQDFILDKAGLIKLTPLAKFFDFFGRIVIGYGIYQFIAAFRRHGRK